MTTAKTQSQELRAASPTAAFSHTPATYPNERCTEQKRSFPHTSGRRRPRKLGPIREATVHRGAGLFGFPRSTKLLLLGRSSAGAAPVRRPSEYSKIRANKAIE